MPITRNVRTALLWRWWLAIGLIATIGFAVAPAGSLGANVLYDLVALTCSLGILAGVRMHRPERPAMWYLLAAGQLLSVAGDVTYQVFEQVLLIEPYPSFADVLYLSGYLCNGIALLLLVRRRRGTIGEFIDAWIIAAGLSMLLWVFVLHPVAAETAGSTLERLVSTTYPAADIVLMALLARILADAAGRTISVWLLISATGVIFVGDTAFTLLQLYAGRDAQATDALFLFSYFLWSGAALHPSMADRGVEGGPLAGTVVGRRRLWLFTAAALLPPALMLLPQVGTDTVDRTAVAFGSAMMYLLAIGRLSGFVGKVQRQSAELASIAQRDELTGLANRRAFDQALLAAGPGRQVAFLGLNGFKNVNDELGRPIGDRVLILMARRLVRMVPSDALVARMGGDEFAVLLTDPDDGAAAALVAALREPVQAGGHTLLVGVAVGVTSGEHPDPVEVLRRAEAAMYAAKRTGEPVRVWTAQLDEHESSHARLGAEMRTALDTGQFRVVYQPIVDLETGQVAAVEALVRWEHPERGLISPVLFVPVAEQNGLIVELGEWVLRTACGRLSEWQHELGPDAPSRVSVNVSARQLNRPGFAATVATALADSRLLPGCLAIEVTETAVFEGGQAVTALHELRALGVRIALDDFGTGHSSLGLLQTVPVDILKVDKSFVDTITSDAQQAVIAEALIHLSTGLGLDAVAEGVETAEQAAALHARGYRLLQGYHFGRPVADPDFAVVRATAAA